MTMGGGGDIISGSVRISENTTHCFNYWKCGEGSSDISVEMCGGLRTFVENRGVG